MSPQSPELFANETLDQLSYTPNLISSKGQTATSQGKKDACLYRKEIDESYYAIKRIGSKIKPTPRKLAERKLREWLDDLEREELSPAPKISFRELLEKYRAVNAGKSSKSKGNIEWAINTLRKSWKQGFDIPVATILASDASSWLAQQKNLKPNSYNELSRQLKNIFELALNDRVISRSPCDGVTNKRERIARDGRDPERGAI